MLRTRTHLTTPPGLAPTTEASEQREGELYTPGLALPAEPKVPMRHRRKVATVAVLAALGLGGWVAFEVATAGQDFDPALDQQLPGEEFDPTIPAPDGDG